MTPIEIIIVTAIVVVSILGIYYLANELMR